MVENKIFSKVRIFSDQSCVNSRTETVHGLRLLFLHREPTQSVCVADWYFIVNVLDLPFASPIAIYR